jgi:hypothetical protein
MCKTAKILMLVENCAGPSDNRVWAEAIALRDYGFQVSLIGPKGTEKYRESYLYLEGIHVYQYRGLPSANKCCSNAHDVLVELEGPIPPWF